MTKKNKDQGPRPLFLSLGSLIRGPRSGKLDNKRQDQGAGRRAQDTRASKTGRKASQNAGTEAQDRAQGARQPKSRTAAPEPPSNKSISRVEALFTKKKFAPPLDQYAAFHAI
jgi:hypothetical protein